MDGPLENVASYLFSGGGLSNQKQALLGLLWDGAVGSRREVALPNMFTMDEADRATRGAPIGELYDMGRLRTMAEEMGIRIRDIPPLGSVGHSWEYFAKGAEALDWLRLWNSGGGRISPDDPVFRVLRGLVPTLRHWRTILDLRRQVFVSLGIDTVAQFRIETDWVEYTNRDLRQRGTPGEEFNLSFLEILIKIRNSFPEMKRLYVTCNEGALPVAKEVIRTSARTMMGIEMFWKSDLLPAFLVRALKPIYQCMVDFEMALHAPRFIGLSLSTFSNHVALEKFVRQRVPVRDHFIYNAPGDRLLERTDNGLHVDPWQATMVRQT